MIGIWYLYNAQYGTNFLSGQDRNQKFSTRTGTESLRFYASMSHES